MIDPKLRAEYEKVKEIFFQRPAAKMLDSLFREIYKLSLSEIIEYYITYGEDALRLLISARLASYKPKDVMREAVEELYNDAAFMEGLPDHVKKMTHDALYHGKYKA